jgi:hypothetical protein
VTALADGDEANWEELVVRENGLPAMLWVYTNPWHFSARRPTMSMTSLFEVSKIEIVTRLAEHLIPLARQAAAAGILIQDFEHGLFGGLLAVGGKVMDAFLESQGNGDLGDVVAHEDQTLHRSEDPVCRPLRTIFGQHQFMAYVYRASPDVKSAILLRPVDERLGLATDRYSPLLQEFSMLFCCEQAFHGSAEAFSRVFGQKPSVDTLEKISRRMAEQGEAFLQSRAEPPSGEEGELLVMTADGKGVPLVKSDAQRLRAFEEKPQRPGNRRMATLAAVYSVDRFVRTPAEIVSALFRDEFSEIEQAARQPRPQPQHKRILARLPGVIDGLGDELVSGSIQALTWASREVSLRRRPGQTLVRLMDGQHSLWNDADACRDEIPQTHCVDILDIVHVASYVWKAAKALCSTAADQQAFARERLLRVLRGEVVGVITGLRRMATLRELPSDKSEEIEKVCGYFTAHQHRMKYDEYLAAGYPIATGVIEGACRHLVKDRLERSGMKWTTEGAQAILTLRSIHASDAWNDFRKFCHPAYNLNA